MILDAELEGERAGTGAEVSKDERIANQAAADFCVPRTRIEGVHSAPRPPCSRSETSYVLRVLFTYTLGLWPVNYNISLDGTTSSAST